MTKTFDTAHSNEKLCSWVDLQYAQLSKMLCHLDI